MISHLLAAALASADVAAAPDVPPAEPARLLATRVEAVVGGSYSGTRFKHGYWGDLPVLAGASGRYVLASGLSLEGTLLAVVPTAPGGISAGANVLARGGYMGRNWTVMAGVLGNYAVEGRPVMQWLPSLRAEVAFAHFGLSAGLFDHGGLAPLHVTAELPTAVGHFSLGYVAPLGAVASFSRPLVGQLSLRAQAIAVRVVDTDQASFTLGLAWGGAR